MDGIKWDRISPFMVNILMSKYHVNASTIIIIIRLKFLPFTDTIRYELRRDIHNNTDEL